MISIHLATALLAAFAATATPAAPTPSAVAPATTMQPAWSKLETYTGTVVRVDASAHTVTTRNDKGTVSVFEPPPSMPSSQLAGFAPGDKVIVTFYEGVDIDPRTSSGTPVATSVDPVTGLRTANVTVVAADRATRTLTFIGPRGEYKRKIATTGDTSVFNTLKAGARIELSYFEYVQSMTRDAGTSTPAATEIPPAPTPAAGDTLRDRMNVYFLYGVDNSFTGKMIEAATGRTTTGVPINLTDTSYDDVYGRLGMIKVGVGYRMTPRLEGVANFVYSNSSANFESIQVGTAGTSPQTPLKVNFTNYRYVGLEVGQRFSFPQGRFSPFAGWLVGINRNQDIRGTFVGVPLSATPGLAAQDGKFFERSWAFSLGPTGGVIINAGPIDVIAETQLRFLGGLSDVDWLVEEGLRDVNSKSERWSWPLLAGVRFKF